MKIRGKLITAFFIMTIIPIALIFLCVTAILNKENAILANTYNIKEETFHNYDILLNPVSFLNNIALADYQAIYSLTQESPDLFLNKQFLEKSNDSLLKKDAYLIVMRNSQYYYIGNEKKFKKLETLPIQNSYDKNTGHLTFIDSKNTSIIKEISFHFTDTTRGQAFLIVNFSNIPVRWFTAVKDIVLAIFFILFSTGTLLVIWIYQSILRPIDILRLATMQIGAGNLNEPIHVSSSDEIGKLCFEFEEMRIRLKSMVEERIQSEENIREMISNISHDLKTPITAIKGYTEGILDGVADTLEKQQKYLQTICTKANDVAYLIDELSLFSKVERNSFAYNFVSVNLENYFTDCIEDVSLDLESKNITIDYYNTTDKETCVLVDTEQLKRVLNNIIQNAVKYNDKPDGHISVRIEEQKIKHTAPPLYRQLKEDGSDLFPQKAPDEFIQVQIEDNGAGIAANDLPHIFDRFYRADASRNSSKRGSGLGLAIVRMIISDHGGKVWAESIEGVGTSFYFTLKKDNKELSTN